MSQQEKGNARVVCPVDGAYCASSSCWQGHCADQKGATTAPLTSDRLQEAANSIRAKLKEEKATYQHYLDHCQKMKDIEDLHGGWDSFANASEVSNRIDTLVWCLEQMGVEP